MVDIVGHIIKILKNQYPNTKATGSKINQNLKEPCFVVRELDVDLGREIGNSVNLTANYNISYINSNKSRKELLEMEQTLLDLLKTINIGKQKLNANTLRKVYAVEGIDLNIFASYTYYGKLEEREDVTNMDNAFIEEDLYVEDVVLEETENMEDMDAETIHKTKVIRKIKYGR